MSVQNQELKLDLHYKYKKLIPAFMEQRKTELEEIRNALSGNAFGANVFEANAFEAIERIGHNLKGVGSSYGFPFVSQCGIELQQAALAEDKERIAELQENLAAYLAKVNISYKNAILFVDDQQEIIQLLRKMFQKEDYITYFATSGQEALLLLKKHLVDVVVTDLQMPEMNGFQLLEIIQNKYPHIIRIVLSGQAQVPSIMRAIETGSIYRYITKPWKVDDQAKAIIFEAISLANEKNKRTSNYIQLPLAVFTRVLGMGNHSYILANNTNYVVGFSEDFSEQINLNKPLDTKSGLMGRPFQKIILDQNYFLYIFPFTN